MKRDEVEAREKARVHWFIRLRGPNPAWVSLILFAVVGTLSWVTAPDDMQAAIVTVAEWMPSWRPVLFAMGGCVGLMGGLVKGT
ncbi:MAG: hypothetical protein F4095_15395 [Acidimicrobiia bacterium]|nr:hypothetical protein [Acidimicrobiia bacterium]